jgi:recombination protein RecA
MGKKFGEGILKKLKDMPQSFDVIPTGSLMLDHALGIGGWPRRCTSTMWGAENSGKTTTAYNSMAQALIAGGSVLFVDKEGKASQGWIRTNIESIGAPTDKLLIAQQPYGDEVEEFTGTQALNLVKAAIKSKEFDLIVVDSAFSLSTPAEEDSDSQDAHMGQLARLLSQYMKSINSALGASNTALLFTNQLRNKIGVMYGNPELMPGGRALYQYSIIIVRLRLGKRFPQKGEQEGVFINAEVQKNQARSDKKSPFQKTSWRVRFDSGIDNLTDLGEYAMETGILYKEEGSNSYFFKEEKIEVEGRPGREATLTAIRENPDLAAQIKETITSK